MSIELTVMSLDFDSDEPPLKQTFHKDEVNFGRADENDIVLPGEEVSNLHARLSYVQENGSGPKLYITDLGSINGTLVDNIPLEPYKTTELGANQRILISGYLIKPKAIETPKTEVVQNEQPIKEASKSIYSKPEQEVDYNEVDSFNSTNFEAESNVFVEEDLISPVEIESSVITHRQEVKPAPISVEGFNPVNVHETEAVSNFQTASSISSLNESQVNDQKSDVEVLVFNFEAKKLCALICDVKRKSQGIADVKISINSSEPKLTDANGSLRFNGIEEGTKVTLVFSKSGYVIEPNTINLLLDSDKKIELTAKKLITVKGRIQHKGQALSGVKVNAGAIGQTITDAQGFYEFSNVIEGTPVNISVEKEGFVFKGA